MYIIKRYVIYIYTLLKIVAISVIVLATWMLTDNKTFLVSIAQEGNNYEAGLYILLAAGILMFIVSFLGCFGALKHSRCSLITFFVIILVIIVAQIAFAGWLYTHSDRLDGLLRSSVINTVKVIFRPVIIRFVNNYTLETSKQTSDYLLQEEYGEVESRTQIMDAIQSGLECCGATGPADWAGSKYASKDPSLPISLTVSSDANNVFKVPESCCRDIGTTACNEGRDMKVAGVSSPAIFKEVMLYTFISRIIFYSLYIKLYVHYCALNIKYVEIKENISLQGCTQLVVDELKCQTYHIMITAIMFLIIEIFGLILALICCCEGDAADRYKA